jgi:hypothetical protein
LTAIDGRKLGLQPHARRVRRLTRRRLLARIALRSRRRRKGDDGEHRRPQGAEQFHHLYGHLLGFADQAPEW